MSNQVVRVQKFTKGSLKNIGDELERAKGVEHRNADINTDLSHLNYAYVSTEGKGFYSKFNQILKNLNCTFSGKSNQIAFEGLVITSDEDFFKSLGWERGKPLTPAVKEFFDRTYEWALQEIGYKGTDKNIIAAWVHLDEKCPHFQLDYIPIVDSWKEKVYAKGEDGKVLKRESGSPIQARDENGKCIYKFVENSPEPKVSRGDFWYNKGGKDSYTEMQDRFFETFTKGYGYKLERGEVGSTRKHTDKNQWEQKQQEKTIADNNDIIEQQEKDKIDLEFANENLEYDNTDLTTKNNDILSQIDQNESKLTELSEDVDKLTAEKTTLSEDVNELNAEKTTLSEDVDKLAAKKATLSEEVNEERTVLARIQAQAAAAQKTVDNSHNASAWIMQPSLNR